MFRFGSISRYKSGDLPVVAYFSSGRYAANGLMIWIEIQVRCYQVWGFPSALSLVGWGEHLWSNVAQVFVPVTVLVILNVRVERSFWFFLQLFSSRIEILNWDTYLIFFSQVPTTSRLHLPSYLLWKFTLHKTYLPMTFRKLVQCQ